MVLSSGRGTDTLYVVPLEVAVADLKKVVDGVVAVDEHPVTAAVWMTTLRPLGTPMTLDRTERRLAAFALAGLDQERMRAWAVIRGAVLGSDKHEVEVLRALV